MNLPAKTMAPAARLAPFSLTGRRTTNDPTLELNGQGGGLRSHDLRVPNAAF